MMMHLDMVYRFPIWVVCVLVVGASAGAAVIVELIARRLLPLETRRANNDVAAAMFSVIGVTFAVLLAFVAMLSFDGYNSARSAAANEAAAARDVADAAEGLGEPARSELRGMLASYLHQVIEREWPAQADGYVDESASPPLRALHRTVAGAPIMGASEANAQAAMLSALARLQDARALRALAATSTVPPIVWMVMLAGGALTVASASFLAAPSARLHLAMSATLAASGALVVVMVIALSQPFRGAHRVSAAPYAVVLGEVEGER
jgi:hypothetical protein